MMKTGQENLITIITEGMERGEIRNDVDEEQLALMISGTLRLLVTRWQLKGYGGDLRQQAGRFWQTLSRLIRSNASTQSDAENAVQVRESQVVPRSVKQR